MAQDTQVRLRGVALNKNQFSEVRDGQCRRAESLVIDRESHLEPRRGFRYESFTPIRAPGKEWKRLFFYQDIAIAHVEDELWRRVSAGSWTQYTGTFEDPDPGYRVRDLVAQKNLYFTSFDGTYRLDDVAGTPVLAGEPAPLDATATLSGSSGFLADDTAVGYRFTLYFTDANGNEHESGVSQVLVVQNTVGGGATRDVAVTCYIPSGLSTSYYWRAYRSAQTEAAADVPSEELQVCAEGQLSSANISAGNFTFTDSTPDNLRGALIYTAPSLGGIVLNNDRPPLAIDLCLFRDRVFYIDYLGRQRFLLRLLGTSTTGVGLRYVADNVSTTNLSAVVTSVADTTLLRVGMKVKAAAGIPATARILSIDTATQITMTVNATATGARDVEFEDIVRVDGVEYFAASATVAASKEFLVTLGGTPSQNIEATARALSLVVNQNASADVYARYVSAVDGTPGQLLFEERGIGSAAFQMSSTATGAWSPTLPSTDNGAQLSKADEKFNCAAISKALQPEAVPVGQEIVFGASDAVRGIALKDGMIVLNIDDIGIVTGTDLGNFRYDQLDATCRVLGPETAVVVNDAVYAMSNQGPVRISTNGVEIAGRDNERDFIESGALTGFEDNAFGLSNETDRAFGLFIPTGGSDEYAKFNWRYNGFTQAWTHNLVDGSCAVVDPATDEILIGDQATMLLRRERRDYARTDYADDELSVTITSSSGTTVNLSSTANLLDNDLLVQGANEIRIVDVVSGTALLMARSGSWSNGAATAYRPIDCEWDTLADAGDDPAVLKKWTEFSLIFREAEFNTFRVYFATDLYPNFVAANAITQRPADTASSWGSTQPTGGAQRNEQVIRGYVPRICQYGHLLYMRVVWSIARERMVLEGRSFKVRSLGKNRAKGVAAAA
jgi:hypothetical protein